ncbi:MAG: hypothetical protein U1C33_06865 [Candidatus Cloacimonadaceae bacterium]|nr:hypothetical protein [Candidatus Cloacimonadaceae bacterium]
MYQAQLLCSVRQSESQSLWAANLLIGRSGAELSAVEIKSAKVFNPSLIKNLKTLNKSMCYNSAELIYGGDMKFKMDEIQIYPYHQIPDFIKKTISPGQKSLDTRNK